MNTKWLVDHGKVRYPNDNSKGIQTTNSARINIWTKDQGIGYV